jgi:hypothetical protein
MALAKKKTAPPTLEEKLNASHARAGAALSVFELAAKDLDEAQAEADEVARFALDEINRLDEIRHAAAAAADAHGAAAAKIRALVA